MHNMIQESTNMKHANRAGGQGQSVNGENFQNLIKVYTGI